MKTRLYVILGIVVVIIVVAAVVLRRPAQTQITHINIPLTEYPTVPPSAPSYTVPVHSIGSSGIAGTATFEDVSGAVAILLHIDGLEEESLAPSEIHFGACVAPGLLAYALGPPDAGESETDLAISLKEFNAKKPMAVLLYRSPQDRTVIACGDIP